MNKRFWDFVSSPRQVLGAAAAVGAVMLILVLFFPIFYRDSVNYMASVNAVWLGNWRTAFNLTFVPLLFLIGALFKPLGLDANQCLSLTSSLLAIAMLFPAYKVLSFYMDRKLAAWGSMLFFLTPSVFHASFAPLTDSSRWFFTFLCWMTILMYREKPHWGKLALLGGFYALFALVRSEGIVFALLFSAGFFLAQWHDAKWKTDVRQLGKLLGMVLLPLFVMGVLLVPRLLQLQRETGFCALDTRQTWALKGVWSHFSAAKAEKKAVDPRVEYATDIEFHYSFLGDKKWSRRYWKNLLTGNYRLYAVFTVIGIALLIRRRKWQRFHTLFCVFMLVNALAYLLMRSHAGRYFYLNTFLMMPFTLTGLLGVWEALNRLPESYRRPVVRCVPAIIVIALAGLLASGMKNLGSGDLEYYYTVGKMMREKTADCVPRSGTEHPVYLIIGENYGWGFHCRASEIVFSETLNRSIPNGMRGIITSGVPADLCSFVVDPLKNVPVLQPDYVLVCDDDGPVGPADCADLLEPIPQNIAPNVLIFKVRAPASEQR